MKRTCFILAIVLSFSIILSACGSKTANDASAKTSSDEAAAKDALAQTDGNEDALQSAPTQAITPAKPENESAKDEWMFYLNGDDITIYGYTGTDSNVTIPKTLKIDGVDRKVTTIAKFTGGEVSSVTIPDSVTSIGNGMNSLTESVFSGKALKSITIPNSVTFIEGNAFEKTTWFQNRPDGPLYIGGVFYGFKGSLPTGDYEIKDGTKTIGRGAFGNSPNLTSVTIPSSVTTIDNAAFIGCTGLTSITIPDSVTTIGMHAFKGCTGLTSITIPDGVTTIGAQAFQDCTNLTSITIPDSVTTVEEGAFYSTPWYTNQPNGPIYIGTVLYGYKGSVPNELIVKDGTTKVDIPLKDFQSITMPDSVTFIKGDGGLGGLFDENWWDRQPDGPVYLGRVLYGYKGDMPANTALEIKEGTVAIANRAFRSFGTLTSVTIPDSVVTIGEAAFSDCNALTSITIPESVTSIGAIAFYGCGSLTSVTLPYSVINIEDRAFSTGPNLTVKAPHWSYAEFALTLAN